MKPRKSQEWNNEVEAFGIPFGNIILRIQELEAELQALDENREDRKAQIQSMLRAAYGELAQKATKKVANWKKGPIIKVRHVSIDELEL